MKNKPLPIQLRLHMDAHSRKLFYISKFDNTQQSYETFSPVIISQHE